MPISTTKKIAGRTRSVARAGVRRSSATGKKTAGTEARTPARRRRKIPADPVPAGTSVVVHPPVDVTQAMEEETPGRTRSSPIVYEAMDLLRTYGYLPVRLSEPTIPINLVGMKKSGSLLICAVRSRLPVPNAAKLRELYTGKVTYLCGMAGKVLDRIMIWVYSPACGWRHYLVYPGGLRFDLDFPKSIG